MSGDVAALGIVVTSEGLDKAKFSLHDLGVEAGKAEAIFDRIKKKPFGAGWSEKIRPIVADTDRLNKTLSATSMHTGNVMAQFNDIGMMMAAGQSPLMLAVQQGTSLNQVWGQMGGKISVIGPLIKNAFLSMLSPINLVTFAVIAGTAALVQWATSAEEGPKTAQDAIEELAEATDNLRAVTGMSTEEMIEKYGHLTDEIRAALAMQQEFRLKSLEGAADTAVSTIGHDVDKVAASIRDMSTEIDRLRAEPIVDEWQVLNLTENMAMAADQIGMTAEQALFLDEALSMYRGAESLTEKANAAGMITLALEGTSYAASQMAADIVDAQVELYAAAEAAADLQVETLLAEAAAKVLAMAGPDGSWFNDAIGNVGTLIGTLWEGVGAANALAVANANAAAMRIPGRGSDIPGATIDVADPREVAQAEFLTGLVRDRVANEKAAEAARNASSGGGGGGGGTDPYQKNLEALMKSLQTEREIVEAWHLEQTALLADNRAIEFMGEQAHKEALLDLEAEYQERLAGIKDTSGKFTLGAAADLFGQLNDQAGGGYEGLLRLQRQFAAAEALINAYRAASQALSDPSLPFFAKFAAAASVLATGIGFVNSIKSGSGSGSSGSVSAGAPAAAQAAPQRVLVDLQGPKWMVDMASGMIDQIYQASKDGAIVTVAR